MHVRIILARAALSLLPVLAAEPSLAAGTDADAPAPDRLEIAWSADFTLFGDNTEFFNDFREGETIFGAQIGTRVEFRTSPRTTFHAGVFGSERFTEDAELDPVLPLLGFRYHGEKLDVLVGTLETRDRHGLLEALEVSELELTRPVESGAQVLLHADRVRGDVFINWQKLNTPDHREVFDYGVRLDADLHRLLLLDAQAHGEHHGGQLYASGPVQNNIGWGVGLSVHGRLRGLGESAVTLHHLRSKTTRDPALPQRPAEGHGTLLRLSARPLRRLELWLAAWEGRDFHAADGDAHYGSTGLAPGFYLPQRSYQEVGGRYRWTGRGKVEYDAEVRMMRVEQEVDYAYRFVIRAPLRLGPWETRRRSRATTSLAHDAGTESGPQALGLTPHRSNP